MSRTEFERDIEMARAIALRVSEMGGRTFYVGGFVRDGLLKKENKDVDIEIHGIAPDGVAAILDSLGERITVGASFGIYGLKGCSVDVAMPRREKLRGTGHKDFDVSVDPFIGTEKAALRRDFTVNALMQDVLTGEIIDHFGGMADLQQGVLRHVCSETFVEDPLRVLRAAQFAARFGFEAAEETVRLCSGMTLADLPRERVEGELMKALLKADRPSVFFETLRRMDRLSEWFCELEALIGVEQSAKYHAEGDVWTHTMMVIDQAARLRSRVQSPAALMLAAVTHDFGKAICSEVKDGVIHAYGHEVKGLPLAERFLNRLTGEKKLIACALNLTALHMRPNTSAQAGSSVKSTNRMFDEALDPEALVCLALADDRGRITQVPAADNEPFLNERLAEYRACMARPQVQGRDLIAAGLTPDARFTGLLAYAHKLHLAGVDKENALRQTLAQARKKK